MNTHGGGDIGEAAGGEGLRGSVPKVPFMSLAESNEYDCDDSLASEIFKVMVKTIRQEDENFGNARFVRNLFEKSIQKQAIRLSKVAPITNKMLRTLTADDLPSI